MMKDRKSTTRLLYPNEVPRSVRMMFRFPVLRVSYDYQDQPPGLRAALDSFLGRYDF